MAFELTGKQRAYLFGLSQTENALFEIGKNGVTPEVVSSIREALDKRELVKVNVLKNCPEEVKDVASTVSARTRSSLVRVIGRRFVLYRRNGKEPVIKLP
ncbi:MAG: YhbY family RNA-binding protein [Lachnospiraceae bacterium]|nr:YhbY family RNA-binding protein [Lachnospiraceae bacterium]